MKKGLSPLIATVLLIGITISMAALVMVWGQTLFRQTTEETGESASAEIDCISKVAVEVLNVSCGTPGTAAVVVDNKNEKPIDGVIVRVYGSGSNVQTISAALAPALGSFSAQSVNVAYTVSGGITKVEVIPQIKLDSGSLHACGQRLDTFSMPVQAAYGCT